MTYNSDLQLHSTHLGRLNRRGQSILPKQQVLHSSPVRHGRVVILFQQIRHLKEWDVFQKISMHTLGTQKGTKIPSQTGNWKDFGTSLFSTYLKNRTNAVRSADIKQTNAAHVPNFSVKGLESV